jgi:hypothetical protein
MRHVAGDQALAHWARAFWKKVLVSLLVSADFTA